MAETRTCQYEPCSKEFTPSRPSMKFCQATCKAAYHREHGKFVGGFVNGIHPRRDGGCTVVVRVPAENSARSRAWLPGQAVQLLEGDQD